MEMPSFLNSQINITRPLLLTGLLLSTIISAVYLLHPGFINSTNNRTTDAVMAFTPSKPASGSVVIIDIDENSLARYGQWPWPRSRFSQLLSTITASGAASIGLDLILAEPDRTSPKDLITALDRKPGPHNNLSLIHI